MSATMTERLVTKLASIGSRKQASRRSFLAAATLTGTALAVDPWGYLTRPQSAYASVCGPGASCNDGWSAMCCSINDGHNTCPPNTYPGGWWKADRSSFCGGAARYYIDCNARPGHSFNCHCNEGSCDHRLVACNIFRYGQCNTQIHGTTAVVCRQISCLPPWKVHPGECGHSSATDNNTAQHSAPCLTKANTFPVPTMFPKAPSVLESGHSLHVDHRLTSSDRLTTLVLRDNGNLVLARDSGVTWQSHTAGRAPGGRAMLHRDGELVVLDKRGKKVWSSNSSSSGAAAKLELRNSGRLVIVHGSHVVWSAETHTP
jgi:hypothetical protein